jgi:hypothetical protein
MENDAKRGDVRHDDIRRMGQKLMTDLIVGGSDRRRFFVCVTPACLVTMYYKFKRGFATPIIFIFDLRRNVPYLNDTFCVEKITLVAELNVIPDAPWW